MTWLHLPPDTGFGLDNLPLGIFSTGGGAPRTGVRMGDLVLDLWESSHEEHHATGSLIAFLARGPEDWRYLRTRLRNELTDDAYRGALEPSWCRSATSPCTCRSRSPTTSTSTARRRTRRTSAG